MRTVKQPDTRKQEILEGAIRVFAKKGYDKTSISDIAKELNISQGLCYRYYASKEEIYDAAIDEYADYIVTQTITNKNLEGKSLKEQILLTSGIMDDYSEAERDLLALYELFHKEGNYKMHDQLFLLVANKIVPYIEDVLKSAMERKEIQISDPETFAYFFVFGQVGILMNQKINFEERTKRIQKCLIELLHLN